jgi:lysozyme
MTKLEAQLIRQEGTELKPYRCTAAKLSIGHGRNLEDMGITEEEALYLLQNDIKRCRMEASKFPWFKTLDDVRQDVIVNMIFNLGIKRFTGFTKTIDALQKNNFELAAKEMLKSQWSKQVGHRSFELSQMMRLGKYIS